MKIAIIGTHSTGKTTILENLSDYFRELGKEVITLPEYARLCPFPINENTTLEAQKWILLSQITEENKIDHKDKILLSDRGTIDNFAYLYRIGQSEAIENFERCAVAHMKTYDFVFKTQKLSLAAKEDGIRTTDLEFRDMIDRLISHLLMKHSIKYLNLPETIDYETHIEFIGKELGLEKKVPKNSVIAPARLWREPNKAISA